MADPVCTTLNDVEWLTLTQHYQVRRLDCIIGKNKTKATEEDKHHSTTKFSKSKNYLTKKII